MINRTHLYTKKNYETIFLRVFCANKCNFLYKKQTKEGSTSDEVIRRSVAGESGVPTAPRVVVAPLGAVMLAAARAASRAAAGAAAEETGDEAGLAAVAAVTAALSAVASGALVLPGYSNVNVVSKYNGSRGIDGGSWTHSLKGISLKRRGLEGTEKVQIQEAAFALVMNIFLLPPGFVHREHPILLPLTPLYPNYFPLKKLNDDFCFLLLCIFMFSTRKKAGGHRHNPACHVRFLFFSDDCPSITHCKC
jgi:hypothetical protein